MKPPAHPSPATAILALARRDLLEFVRDRRTLVITLLLPMAVYPILTLATTLGLQTATRALDAQMAAGRIQVGLSGPDAAGLARLMQRTIETTSRNERAAWPSEIVLFDVDDSKAEELLDRGGIDLWVATPAGLLADLAAARPVRIPVRVSASRPATTLAREQFAEFMQSLGRDVARDRLEAAGLSGALLEPLAVVFAGDSGSAAPPPTQAIIPTIIGGILVMLTVLTLTGAFYPAIDAIAGEKERGTIETLLIAPCRTTDVVYGKFLSVLAITLATLVANVVSIAATVAVALRYLPKGVVAALPEGALGTALLVTVLAFTGMAALAAATCLAVTTASKSGKEAQNTLTPVILLVSAVAGTALLPGMDGGPLLAAVPFAGQIVVARAAVGTGAAPPATAATILATLATSLASSAVVTWLLLRLTAGTLADEDVLFRGPDVAGSPLQRPARRLRPNAVQALVPLVAGFAGLWYAQGLVPSDLCWAIPVQQVIAGLAPLAFVTWWQRVDLRDTFSWRWPGRGGRSAGVLLGALLVGGGLFVLGAAALLAVRPGGFSDEVRQLSSRLVALVRERPWWLSWSLIAVVPAVCEELVFRGWVLAGLLGRGQSPARTAAVVVAQALAFALFHLLPERMPQAFALGVVNGLLVVATRSLLPAIACHLAHNSVPVALLLLAADVPGLAAAAEGGTSAVAALPAWFVAVAASAVAVGAGLIAAGRHDRTHEETAS